MKLSAKPTRLNRLHIQAMNWYCDFNQYHGFMIISPKVYFYYLTDGKPSLQKIEDILQIVTEYKIYLEHHD